MAVAPDQGLADVGPGDPQPDAGSSPDASPGDPQPDAGAADLDAAPAVDAAVADAAVRDLGPGDPQPAFDFGVEADAFDLGPGDPQPRFDLGTVGDTKDAAPYDATPARAEAGPTGDTSGGATDSGCRATPTAAPLWLALLALGWRRRRA
jgi:hypothetical protein